MDRGTLADELRRARFRTTQMRPGYDEREVDDFLERVVARLRSDEPAGAVAASVDGARFTTTSFRRGYDMVDVDDALLHVVESLGAASGVAGSVPAAASSDAWDGSDASHTSESGDLPSALIEPKPGLLGRLARAVRGD
ncbi:DivIVA domain-containing protein [Intrasporangium sp. YIM S08009]|uniref:DivIVA domain-containing protein n=1 Tax=Intrasporangium zincisolvens TaxID=3080018 RepID=UPI002B05C5E0|nr:DivIVA domain-containing protein [Intrasporangium sp. YIM S08009]